MTLDDVRRAKATLEQAGTYPSYTALLAQLGGGSKRELSTFLKHLATEEPTASAVAPAPRVDSASRLGQAQQARDQTAQAELALGLEEQRLKVTRDALDDARTQLAIQQQTVRTDAADLERRRQGREVQTNLANTSWTHMRN